MPDEQTPPSGQEVTGEGQPQAKSTQELMAELTQTSERLSRLEKQVQEKETFIGRQSTEIGELRKKLTSIETPRDTAGQPKDPLEEEIKLDLMRTRGMDEETASFNAGLLSEMGRKVVGKISSANMMNEVIDKVEDAFDDKKLDRAFFEGNQDEIMAEFKGRKLAPTAGKNYRILKDCYDVVLKRKADVAKQEQSKKDEGNREKLIADGQPMPSSSQPSPGADEDEKARQAIRNSGGRESSAFF